MAMAAVPPTDQTRPMRTAADLEAAIAALPGRKERLRESFDRLVACAPPDSPLPFAWDDIDAHVSSLHASFSLRFRQMQQQQPHPCASVSSIATDDDDEQPRPGTATPEEDEQPHPGAPVSPTHTHDDESVQEEDEEMVIKDEDASPVQEDEDEDVGKDREDQEMFSKDEDASPVQEDEDDDVGKDREDGCMGFEGATFCHGAGGTRDQELPVPMRVRARPDAGNRLLRQPYMAFPPTGVLSQLNLPMLQGQQPFMPYQQEFHAMAVAMNNFNIPPMVQQQPYFNIPPMVQQQPHFNIPPMVVQQPPYVPNLRQEFFPDFSQEFFPDMMMRQPPMGIGHVLQQQFVAMAHRQHYFSQQQYMAMAQHQPYFPQQQQYMPQHEHRFPVAQAASAHGQGSNAKRGRRFMTTDTDAINVLMREPSKKSRPIQHHAEPKPIDELIQKKTIYDYF